MMKFSKKILYFLLCFLCNLFLATVSLFILDFLIQFVGRAMAYLVLFGFLLLIIPLITFLFAEHFSKNFFNK